MEKVLTTKELKELQDNPKVLELWIDLVEKGEKMVVSMPEIAEEQIQKARRANCPWWGWIWCNRK